MCHGSVCDEFSAAESLGLYPSYTFDILFYLIGFTRSRFPAELGETDRRYVDVNIYPVEQRAGDLGNIAFYLPRSAFALSGTGTEISAWTWIHRGDKHKLCWKSHTSFGAGNRNRSFFEGLADHLEYVSWKFREFIEKQYSMISKAQLAWSWICSASYKSRSACSVMRRSEGTDGYERIVFFEQADRRINSGRFKRLLEA